jgi:hypothetical protein
MERTIREPVIQQRKPSRSLCRNTSNQEPVKENPWRASIETLLIQEISWRKPLGNLNRDTSNPGNQLEKSLGEPQ